MPHNHSAQIETIKRIQLATDNALARIALWLGPARLAVGLLGWAFDYLPHHGLNRVPSEDRFKTTRNRVGAEPVLTPLPLYHNHHLVHHLHPVIPQLTRPVRTCATTGASQDATDGFASRPARTTHAGRTITVRPGPGGVRLAPLGSAGGGVIVRPKPQRAGPRQATVATTGDRAADVVAGRRDRPSSSGGSWLQRRKATAGREPNWSTRFSR